MRTYQNWGWHGTEMQENTQKETVTDAHRRRERQRQRQRSRETVEETWRKRRGETSDGQRAEGTVRRSDKLPVNGSRNNETRGGGGRKRANERREGKKEEEREG